MSDCLHHDLSEGERCQCCGERYLTVYRLPDELWARITPRPESPGGGLLCPACADERARELGVLLVWSAS